MNVMIAMPKDSPLMVAWETYKASDSYANARAWVEHEDHVDGSLWAAFEQGWRCATARAAGLHRDKSAESI